MNMKIQEAANLLNVSQPFLIKLLEEGKIPCFKAGLQQFICSEDVIKYKKQRDTQRREGLRELSTVSSKRGVLRR